MKPPTPHPQPLTEITEYISRDSIFFVQTMWYPESFVKIEEVVRKKINFYYSEWVWNPLSQMNMKACIDMICSGN